MFEEELTVYIYKFLIYSHNGHMERLSKTSCVPQFIFVTKKSTSLFSTFNFFFFLNDCFALIYFLYLYTLKLPTSLSYEDFV